MQPNFQSRLEDAPSSSPDLSRQGIHGDAVRPPAKRSADRRMPRRPPPPRGASQMWSRRMKPVTVQWSPTLDREFIDQVLARNVGRPGGLLAILQQIQNNHPQKYLPRETIEYVAAKAKIPLSRILQRRHVLRAVQSGTARSQHCLRVPWHRLPHQGIARPVRKGHDEPGVSGLGGRRRNSCPSPPPTAARPCGSSPASGSARWRRWWNSTTRCSAT